MMLLRIRKEDGSTFRIKIELADKAEQLIQLLADKIPQAKRETFAVSNTPRGKATALAGIKARTIGSLGFKHGDLLFVSYEQDDILDGRNVEQAVKETLEHKPEPLLNGKPDKGKAKSVRPWENIQEDQVDLDLQKIDGKILRSRDQKMCKHGANAMCDYCMPLEPFDRAYLDDQGIKYLSFHSYLKKLDIDRNKSASQTGGIKTTVIPPLEEADFRVKKDCTNGHPPWPEGICSKCQPGAITLQQQEFRMVDHVEFAKSSLIDDFLNVWRATGGQRLGFLFGRYEQYLEVPLGIKAVVEAIYEPAQEGDVDGISMGGDFMQEVERASLVAKELGLQQVGIVFTDLVDDGSGKGTVLPKRHADSFFLSSLEIYFAAQLQLQHRNPSSYSTSGFFSSKFITCVISGDLEGGVEITAYQMSNSAMAMVEADIIEPSMEPGMMRVKEPVKSERYVPEVFHRFRNEYGVAVQESAKPAFPVEYLIVTVSHGFPSVPKPLFRTSRPFSIENRPGLSDQSLASLVKHLKLTRNGTSLDEDIVSLLSDFHLLLFSRSLGILEPDSLKLLDQLGLSTAGSEERWHQLLQSSGWQNLVAIAQESGFRELSGSEGCTLTSIVTEDRSSMPDVGTDAHHSNNDVVNLDDEISGQGKICPHCTFENDSSSIDCNVCGLPLS